FSISVVRPRRFGLGSARLFLKSSMTKSALTCNRLPCNDGTARPMPDAGCTRQISRCPVWPKSPSPSASLRFNQIPRCRSEGLGAAEAIFVARLLMQRTLQFNAIARRMYEEHVSHGGGLVPFRDALADCQTNGRRRGSVSAGRLGK